VLRSIRKWTTATGLALMAAGAAVLMAAPASAADSPAELTFTPTTGKDVTYPVVHTAAGCPADSDSYWVTVTGPGLFATPQLLVPPGDVDFSHDSGFDVQIAVTMKDAAEALGLSAVPVGDYQVTLNCVISFPGDVKKTYGGVMHFATETDYTTGPAASPSGSPSTSGSPSPSATPTGTPTPDPTETTDPAPTTTSPTPNATTTPPAASGAQLPVTGPPAGGIVLIGVLFILVGSAIVLGTTRFERPVAARW
jgi:hypothetical protein